MDVNTEDIEELILLLIDNELSQAETLYLMDFLKKNPEYNQLLESYSITKLVPEDNIEYPWKNQLLRPESKQIAFYKRTKMMLGVVSTLIIMVLGIALIWLQKPKQNTGNLVWETQNNPVPIKAQGENVINNPPKAIPNQKNALVQHREPVHKHQNKLMDKNNKPPYMEPHENEQNIDGFAVSSLKTQGIKLWDIDENPVVIMPIKMPPELIAVDPFRKKSVDERSWKPRIEWTSEVSFDENRLKGFVFLINQVQETRLKVAENIAVLKKSTIVLQLGNKEIALNKQN